MVAVLQMPRRVETSKGAERRIFPRKVVHTRVDSVRMDHTLSARRQPQVSLALRDLSAGGISAISHLPLDAGERLTVYFPPQGASRGWDAYGRVIRCEPSGLGYRVAVEFDHSAAAA